MKFNKDDLAILIGSGMLGASLCFGLGMAVRAKPAQILLSSLAGSIPGALISYQVTDSINSKKQRQLIDAHRRELEDIKAVLARVTKTNNSLTKELRLASQLRNKLSKLETALDERLEQIKVLEEANQEWEQGFDSLLEKQSSIKGEAIAQKKIQEEVVSIFDHHNEFTQRAIKIALDMKAVLEEADGKNEGLIKRDKEAMLHFIDSMDESDTALNEAKAAFEEEKNILKAQIQYLERQVNGELLEPVYGQHGYDIPAQIATDLCRELWNSYQIPLRLEGVKGDSRGLMIAGYGYGSNQSSTALVSLIKEHSKALCKQLGIHQITKVEKLPIAPVIAVSFRREPALKQDNIKELVGSSEEFLKWIGNQSYRFRLIAAPGFGKSPSIVVIVSHILKVGGKKANIPSGQLIPNIDLTLSYPGIDGSEKDTNYPLEPFVKYRTWEDAHASFNDFHDEWKYREKHREYRQGSFGLWVWDEFDNSLTSASNSRELGASFKECLKQAHHTNMGFIIAGQSVNTKALPGFTNNDRNTLFTEIVCGIPVIREFLDLYGKKLGSKKVTTILANLDDIEEWINSKNKNISDTAREYRLVLAVDEKSPKLFFLPNLDNYSFDYQAVSNSVKNRSTYSQKASPDGKSLKEPATTVTQPKKGFQQAPLLSPSTAYATPSTQVQNNSKCHCPSCGSDKVIKKGKGKFGCKNPNCKRKTFVESKAVWK